MVKFLKCLGDKNNFLEQNNVIKRKAILQYLQKTFFKSKLTFADEKINSEK